MTSESNSSNSKMSASRWLVAGGIGLLFALVVWVVTPFSDFIVGNTPISNGYLPVAAVFLVLVVVLFLNPVLYRLFPSIALTRRQLALTVAIVLMASVPAGVGLLSSLPYALANTVNEVRQSSEEWERYEPAQMPDSLFPDPLQYGGDIPNSKDFISRLRRGETVPWGAWVPPLVTWGSFTILTWMMMLGLALLVLPQWRDNERLQFPLLMIYQALIERPEPGKAFAPGLRQKGFWMAAAAVFFLHLLNGLNKYFPDGVPAVPLQWNLGSYFSEEPFLHLPDWIKQGQLYFVVIGITFFMSNRIAFSIWFFAIAYGTYAVIGNVYSPPFYESAVGEQRAGAMVVLAIAYVWLGRTHWARVARACVSAPKGGADLRNMVAGWTFVFGLVGMAAWLMVLGVSLHIAAILVAMGFVLAIVVTRVVAETGLPMIDLDAGGGMSRAALKRLPVTWFNARGAFFTNWLCMWFGGTSVTSATAMSAHALQLDEEASPKYRAALIPIFIGVMTLALVVCGASHLYFTYHHHETLNGLERPINRMGLRSMTGSWSLNEVVVREQWYPTHYNAPLHTIVGAALGGGLQWASTYFAKWPLHPVGLILVYTKYGQKIWISVLFGWLLKLVIIDAGGAGLYRRARPIFVGLIMGEVFAAVFWAIVPLVLVRLGDDNYQVFHILVN